MSEAVRNLNEAAIRLEVAKAELAIRDGNGGFSVFDEESVVAYVSTQRRIAEAHREVADAMEDVADEIAERTARHRWAAGPIEKGEATLNLKLAKEATGKLDGTPEPTDEELDAIEQEEEAQQCETPPRKPRKPPSDLN